MLNCLPPPQLITCNATDGDHSHRRRRHRHHLNSVTGAVNFNLLLLFLFESPNIITRGIIRGKEGVDFLSKSSLNGWFIISHFRVVIIIVLFFCVVDSVILFHPTRLSEKYSKEWVRIERCASDSSERDLLDVVRNLYSYENYFFSHQDDWNSWF